MCGIFGYIGNKKEGQKIVFEGLKSLEYRGYDSWGVGVIPSAGGTIAIKKKTGKIGNSSIKDMPSGSIAFGHTRWATHGGVTEANAHPHLDCTKKIAVIHNGIFENYEEIKEKLIKNGHKFISETDTEALTHLIEDYSKHTTFEEAVRKTFNQMEGLNAVIALSSEENVLVAARNGSPLVVGFGDGENFLASDASALAPYTRVIYYLEDDQMAVISKSEVRILNARTGKKVNIHTQKFDWHEEEGSKGKFEHFMLKEIFEQPDIIESIAAAPIASQAEKIAKIIKEARGTYLVGCGTAYYACLAGQYLFSKIAKRHVNPAVGSEFGYSLDFLNKDSLVIAISQSGETMDILESVKKAKAKGAKILSLVNVPGSSLYRLSDYKVLIGAGQEKAVASTKALTAMISHLILLANCLNGGVKMGQKSLLEAVHSINQVLSPKSLKLIDRLATKIVGSNHIYVIGRGLSYPASLETALKIKEISYIHAEGLAAGELKHGPLALIEKGTPCISFLPNDETYGANLAGAMEMRARGGYIIGISYKPHEIFDYYINIPDASEASIIPEIIASQILAYRLTVKKGLDPDKPRNLAKSVTVK